MLTTGSSDARVAEHGGVARGARSHLDVYQFQGLVVAILSNQRQSAATGGAHPVASLAHGVADIFFDNR